MNAYLDFQQGMIDKDINLLDSLTADDIAFVHMSGKTQTKSEYFDEIKNGTLNYFKSELVKLDDISIKGNVATINGETALTARVYGISGTWTLPSGGYYQKINDIWISSNK